MKMKYFAVLMVVILFFSFSAWAADYSKAEVFGGYQYTRIDGGGLVPNLNANGWNAAVSGYFSKYMGVTGDFSGAYTTVSGVKVKVHTYTFGPVFTARNDEAITPFAHVLVGGFHGSAGVAGISGSTSGLAIMAGGGVDAKIAPRLAFRVAQFDWVLLRAEGETTKKNFRLSTGIIFRF